MASQEQPPVDEVVPHMYTVPEVAQIFGVQGATIREWIKEGILPAQKIGKGHYWRVLSTDVIKLANKKYGDPNDNRP